MRFISGIVLFSAWYCFMVFGLMFFFFGSRLSSSIHMVKSFEFFFIRAIFHIMSFFSTSKAFSIMDIEYNIFSRFVFSFFVRELYFFFLAEVVSSFLLFP